MIDNDFINLVNSGVKRSTDNWGTGIILQHPQTKKILLAKRVDTGDYGGPGGKVELSESPRDGILRETKEESNITIRDMSCYDFKTHTSPNGKNWVDFLFYSNNFDDSDIKNQPSEMGEFGWYDVSETMRMNLFPPTRAGIERALELGLLDGTADTANYIPFVDCPTSATAVMDSPPCQYSFQPQPEVFDSPNYNWYEWD